MRTQPRLVVLPLVVLAFTLPASGSAQQASDPTPAAMPQATVPAAAETARERPAAEDLKIVTVRDYCMHLDRVIPESLREAPAQLSEEVKWKAGLWNTLNCAQLVYGPGGRERTYAPDPIQAPGGAHRPASLRKLDALYHYHYPGF